ncbi:hypothetical protein Ahy_B07g088326 [Arachis hypogaea]|uniref:CCHC-type domain-containing protein n=1 Tax=Arachis hypogaea TaxID=3818 RepID=A0A444YE71_ARAHY|nr:hypothetical protein Ahy_B07g088326 [Arachis hypogaea]
MSKNRAANRRWLAGKLVKKLRRYPSLKHSMPCVHACTAISKINRNSEDFCHHWLTMEAYRDTYKHSFNPIPGQDLWERSEQNRPHAPKMKRKPGPIIQKRRKDGDEEPSSVKKSKTETKLKRKYKEFTCTYCGTRGHTKRSCSHRKADDLASALVSAAAAVVAKEKGSKAGETRDPANAATSNTQAAEINKNAPLAPGEGVDDANASEIDLTQPTYSQPENQEQVPPSDPPPPPQQVTRPDKLQSKRTNARSKFWDSCTLGRVYDIRPHPGLQTTNNKIENDLQC